MYKIEVVYHAEDRKGDVHRRQQTLVIAPQPGERIVTDPKVTLVQQANWSPEPAAVEMA